MKKEPIVLVGRIPYYNCLILAPDGARLGYCGKKKESFYIKHGLATVECRSPTRTIRLTFEPKGRLGAEDEAIISPRKNICVVCGFYGNLTKHHIVPSCYRVHFPDDLKRHNSHDVVALCREHHDEYEALSVNFKKELAEEYGVIGPFVRNVEFLDLKDAIGAAKLVLEANGNVPRERIEVLKTRVSQYLGRTPSQEDLKELAAHSNPQMKKTFKHGYLLVQKLIEVDGIQDFVIRWRKHFLATMSPAFMPDGWNVNYKIER